ncbi:MAG: O-acetyl-ADP-ribose deacetylase [Candidatus Dormibacteria bacterium]
MVRADITTLDVEAVVNAANSQLAGGSGVDGAIHRAAGSSLKAETRERFPAGCPTGGAVTTGAGQMKARWVIHAVGPVWRGGNLGEDELLASAWRASLQECVAHGARSVAFPSISTGVYGFPVERAARLASGVVRTFLEELPPTSRPEVVVCTFGAGDERVYSEAFAWAADPP